MDSNKEGVEWWRRWMVKSGGENGGGMPAAEVHTSRTTAIGGGPRFLHVSSQSQQSNLGLDTYTNRIQSPSFQMATAVSTVGSVNRVLLSLHGSSSGASAPSSAFLGNSLKKGSSGVSHGRVSTCTFKVMAADLDESKQTSKDRWRGLAYDMSDDQQDITRGKGMVNPLFQAPMGDGTHEAVLSSYEYISQGLRQYNFDNTMDGYYIAPAFMDKLVVHITKNFMNLPNIKVPLILGIWGGKGQGKSFQCELVFAKMGIKVYDDKVRKWIAEVGVEKVGKKLVNSLEGPPTFEQPKMTLSKLMEYGNMLVQEQENVKRVQLADTYLSEAALGNANEDAMKAGTF
ncbi:uncharacterized protein A4U43_C07F510 [Asparagus officinalis]|uniref:Ribulose bisphosphate carboxylase/oxygenase activase AAA helical domain-containing protein n=1 Tax=Asparagus officinalis TaxID=4686 RepID=A0A5P1E890_ASPOF|nr:uncharacterized protein A4U43_C07F510 [Asparagus officinalis]